MGTRMMEGAALPGCHSEQREESFWSDTPKFHSLPVNQPPYALRAPDSGPNIPYPLAQLKNPSSK